MDQALISRLGKVHAAVSSIDQRLQYETATARLSARIKTLEEEKAELIKAVGTLDRCVQIISANGIGKIEGIVSDGLQRVFRNKKVGLLIEKKKPHGATPIACSSRRAMSSASRWTPSAAVCKT